jgi:hypothetical protein
MTSYTKAKALRDKTYLRWVASLPCAHCGIVGYSQAAHSDQGKGMGIKSGDDTCYPACGPHYQRGLVVSGCHWEIGTSGHLSKEERRELEAKYAEQTRALYEQSMKPHNQGHASRGLVDAQPGQKPTASR